MVKTRVPEYLEAYKIAGVTTVCDMIDLFKTTILNELENPNVRIVTQLESSDALLAMIRYPGTGDSDGITIAELSQKGVFAQNCVFAGIMKKGQRQGLSRRQDFPSGRSKKNSKNIGISL